MGRCRDWHANRRDDVVEVLLDAGVVVLDRDHAILDIGAVELGVSAPVIGRDFCLVELSGAGATTAAVH